MQNHHILGSFQRVCGPPEEHSQLFFNKDSTPVYQIWSVKNTPDTTRLNCHGTTQPGPPHLTEQSAEHPTPGSLSLQPGTDITFPPPHKHPLFIGNSIYRAFIAAFSQSLQEFSFLAFIAERITIMELLFTTLVLPLSHHADTH